MNEKYGLEFGDRPICMNELADALKEWREYRATNLTPSDVRDLISDYHTAQMRIEALTVYLKAAIWDMATNLECGACLHCDMTTDDAPCDNCFPTHSHFRWRGYKDFLNVPEFTETQSADSVPDDTGVLRYDPAKAGEAIKMMVGHLSQKYSAEMQSTEGTIVAEMYDMEDKA